MKMKKIFIWSAIIVSILGTLLHFAYDWSGQNTLVGLFTPVNESTWEHMKLIFFPTLIVNIFIWRKLHDKLPYLDSSLPAWLLIGTWLIPTLFYTYRGILGYGISAIDIGIFFISVFVTFLLAYRQAYCGFFKTWKMLLIIIILLMIIGFFWFTYDPPMLGIFKDPEKVSFLHFFRYL